jgi:superfamily II DNA helicase RecQ
VSPESNSEFITERNHKLLDMIFFCENQYICRQILLSKYYSQGQSINNTFCNNCDNCTRRQKDDPIQFIILFQNYQKLKILLVENIIFLITCLLMVYVKVQKIM